MREVRRVGIWHWPLRLVRGIWALTPRCRWLEEARVGWMDGPLIRQFATEPWFLVATTGCALVVALTSIGIPRLWRCSPDGFLPEIRVSGFDLLEAKIESRAAQRSHQQSDYPSAA